MNDGIAYILTTINQDGLDVSCDNFDMVIGEETELLTTEFAIMKVIFHGAYTIVLWKNGEITTVKCQDGDFFDREKGLAMAIIKYIVDNNSGQYNNIFKQWCH